MTELSFEEQLDQDMQAQSELEPDYSICQIVVNGKLRRLKFTQMDGLAWADVCDRNPPRLTSEATKAGEVPKVLDVDRVYGYNVLGASILAATTSGLMQSGEDWVPLSADRWKKLIRGLAGAQLRAIADAIFQLNQWAPALAVTEAKKAFEVESAMKSFSPALSESPAPDSSQSGPAAT